MSIILKPTYIVLKLRSYFSETIAQTIKFNYDQKHKSINRFYLILPNPFTSNSYENLVLYLIYY